MTFAFRSRSRDARGMLAECSCSHESWQATKFGQGKIRAISLSESPARTISLAKKMEFAVAFGQRAAVYGHGAMAADSFVALSTWRRFGRAVGFPPAAAEERCQNGRSERGFVGRRSRGGRPLARRGRLAPRPTFGPRKSARPERRASTPYRSPREAERWPNTVVEKVPSTVCLPCSCTSSADNHEAPMFEFRPIRQDADSSNVAKLAIKAGVAICLCIVVSEWLANAAQRGELPRVALVWPESEPWRGVKARPSPQATGSVTVYRNIGVDGVTTSTIPRTYTESSRDFALRRGKPVKGQRSSTLIPNGLPHLDRAMPRATLN